MTKFKNTEGFDRYCIRGKTYYKVGEEVVPTDATDIISEIWQLKNVDDEEFRLFIRYQRNNTCYSLYSKNGTCILRTYGIRKIETVKKEKPPKVEEPVKEKKVAKEKPVKKEEVKKEPKFRKILTLSEKAYKHLEKLKKKNKSASEYVEALIIKDMETKKGKKRGKSV